MRNLGAECQDYICTTLEICAAFIDKSFLFFICKMDVAVGDESP